MIKRFKNWICKHPIWFGLIIVSSIAAGTVVKEYYMTAFSVDGYRITSINNGVLNNGDTCLPTSESVYNAIIAASLTGGSDPVGWLDILNYGGVANGGFSSGTDNSPAMNAAIAAAVNNSVIYIPPGNYRFLSTITWPTDKRVFLISYGDLYFNTNTGFLVDGDESAIMWFNGRILGTDESGTPNYTGLTNAGIYIRNSKNNVFHANVISGFQHAIRIGGFASGTSTAMGAQYNKISWNWLWRNSVGVMLAPTGGTTNSNGNWCNSNFFNCGQITADTGIVFRKDVTQGDRFNGNHFRNIGFEYAGNGVPMKVGIRAEFALNNSFSGYRFEPNGVTKKILFTADCDAFQFYGEYFQDSWLTDPGNSIVIIGSIFSNSGILIGNEAYGYQFSATNTFQNQRVKIKGLARSSTVAGELASNIDVEWDIGTDVLTGASAFTVPVGAKLVQVNYTSGTSTITLPGATTNPNRIIRIKNLHATNNVIVSGPISGSIVNIPALGSVTYESDGNNWYDISTRIRFGTIVLQGDANYSVAGGVDEVVYQGALTAARTITLPTASSNTNRELTIRHAATGGFAVNFSPAIRGDASTTYSSMTNKQWVKVKSTGTDWYIIAERLIP